jgi:multicomponent Na+:H+ antiporter subunit D
MCLGALGLVGLPPFATGFGTSLIDHASEPLGLWWVPALFMISGILTASAVLRVSARIFLGLGDVRSPATYHAPKITEESETKGQHKRTPYTMWVPPAVLMILAMALAISPTVRQSIIIAADRAAFTHLFRNTVLNQQPAPLPVEPKPHAVPEIIHPLIALAIALALAALALYPRVLPHLIRQPIDRTVGVFLGGLRRLHSGRVCDYVAWLVFGIAAYGLLLVACT